MSVDHAQDVKDIARHDTDDHKGEVKDVEIVHVLDKPWSYDNNPIWLRFSHILLEEVRSLTETAVQVDGLTVSDFTHFIPFRISTLTMDSSVLPTKSVSSIQLPMGGREAFANRDL